MLLAYDVDGSVIATLDHLVAHDEHGEAIGLVDFEAHEVAGGKLRDIWEVSNAVGSGTWPEWLGGGVHDFRVELDAAKRITALVHKQSGYRRERASVDAAIEAVEPDASGARDIRHLVGGPMRPIRLDADGKTAPPVKAGTPAHLPLMGGPRGRRVG